MVRGIGLLLASILVAACQAGEAPTAAPASVAATPTQAPAPATPTAPAKPLVLPRTVDVAIDGTCENEDQGCLGLLEAGKTYTTTTFKPTVSFSVPTSDWDNPNEAGGEMPLFSTKDVGDVIFFFSHARSFDPKVGTTFDQIVAWLQSYDKLTVTPAAATTVGGLKGVTMDIRIREGATSTDPQCPVQVCVPILRGDDPVPNDPYQWHWEWGAAGTETQRVYLLNDSGNTVAIFVDSIDGRTFESITKVFDQMLPTIKFS